MHAIQLADPALISKDRLGGYDTKWLSLLRDFDKNRYSGLHLDAFIVIIAPLARFSGIF